MANVVYPKGKEALLGSLDWSAATIRVLAVGNGYSFSTAHSTLSNIAALDRLAISSPLTSKTIVNGVADADPITFSGLNGPFVIHFLVIYESTGTDSTSRLISFFDTGNGLPFTVSGTGSSLTVTWSTSPDGIFTL